MDLHNQKANARMVRAITTSINANPVSPCVSSFKIFIRLLLSSTRYTRIYRKFGRWGTPIPNLNHVFCKLRHIEIFISRDAQHSDL